MKNEQGFSFFPQTCDVLVFNIQAAQFRESGAFTNLVLVKRKNDPFKGDWAIPGGFMNEGESIPECAARELEEETSIKPKILIPIGTFSDPKRDPRGCTISSAFAVVIPTGVGKKLEFKAGDDAAECALFNLKGKIDEPSNSVECFLRCVENGERIAFKVKFTIGPFGVPKAEIEYDMERGNRKLAFDHAEILARAILRMPALVSESAVNASPVAHAVAAEKPESMKVRT